MGRLRLHVGIQAVFHPLKLLLAAAGTTLGLTGVVIGIALGDIALSLYTMLRASRELGIGVTDLLHDLQRSVLVTIITAAAAWGGYTIAGQAHYAWAATGVVVGGALGWLASLLLSGHDLLHEFTRLRDRLCQRRRANRH